MPNVALKDVPSNPSQAEVDDLVLVAGGAAQSMTDDQLTRLKATGVKLTIDDDKQTTSATPKRGEG